MKTLTLILTQLLALFFTQTALAADGSSGCGPGWYLLKNNSILSSALRATTNTVLFPATSLGMTFGTSHCTRHGIVNKEKETLYFLTHNYLEVKAQAAIGSGAHLIAFAQTMGCSSLASPRLGQSLKQSFSKIFQDNRSGSPEQSLLQIYKVILQEPQLSKQCDFLTLG